MIEVNSPLLTEVHFADLKNKGYTVVKDVVASEDCDKAVAEYQEWLSQFGNSFPETYNSLVEEYNIAHMDATWRIRLKSKPVFASIWKTDKLLSSFDAISIGRPPEDGVEGFQNTEKYWLHSDQHAKRKGLHAYQGAVYMIEQEWDDWVFQVMEGSHNHLEAFYEQNSEAADSSMKGHYDLTEDDTSISFFNERGCGTLRVPVPKGGMAVWDSRLIHANARPLQKRKNAGKWRFTIFVSMTPAKWASQFDLAAHKEAYDDVLMTTHWSSQGLVSRKADCPEHIKCQQEIPISGQTEEAKLLSGALSYNFYDGLPNGDDNKPQWMK